MATKDASMREVSPEEYRQMSASDLASNTNRPGHWIPPGFPLQWARTVLTMAVVIVSLLIGFAAGIHYQTQKGNRSAAGTSTPGGYGNRGGRRAGSFGQVSAVSSTSITVRSSRTGSSQTFAITSSTIVTNNGATASVKDIKTGDAVIIRASYADPATARTIDINPSFGGGPGMMSAPITPSDNSSESGNESTI